MLFGVQASQDVKLSNIARSLKEDMALIKTEDRLSRNLDASGLESHLSERLAAMGSRRVENDAGLGLDISDLRKGCAEKREYLAKVRDSSTGELHGGYRLCDITAAQVKESEIVPLHQKLYSVEAEGFRRENAEILAGVDLVRTYTRGRGIWGARSRRGPEAAAGAPAAICDPLHGEAFGHRPTPSEGEPSRAGRALSSAVSSASRQD